MWCWIQSWLIIKQTYWKEIPTQNTSYGGKKRNLPMLLCIWNLDSKVDEVVTVKTSGVVVESDGVPHVTLTFPPRPP